MQQATRLVSELLVSYELTQLYTTENGQNQMQLRGTDQLDLSPPFQKRGLSKAVSTCSFSTELMGQSVHGEALTLKCFIPAMERDDKMSPWDRWPVAGARHPSRPVTQSAHRAECLLCMEGNWPLESPRAPLTDLVKSH